MTQIIIQHRRKPKLSQWVSLSMFNLFDSLSLQPWSNHTQKMKRVQNKLNHCVESIMSVRVRVDVGVLGGRVLTEKARCNQGCRYWPMWPQCQQYSHGVERNVSALQDSRVCPTVACPEYAFRKSVAWMTCTRLSLSLPELNLTSSLPWNALIIPSVCYFCNYQSIKPPAITTNPPIHSVIIG